MGMTEEAIRASVRGSVQGVGYRAAVVDQARTLGVLGWVRNEDDGGVLVHAEGPAGAVLELVAFLRNGPPAAAVTDLAVHRAKVEGHEQFAVRGVPAGRFVVEEYPGASSFFVMRLEVDGAPRSWRLPRGPSMNPADKRFATQLDDGPAQDAPAIWDEGPYEQGGRVPWPAAIDRGHAVFVLHGSRLRGGFALQRTRGSGWLLIKRRDDEARPA